MTCGRQDGTFSFLLVHDASYFKASVKGSSSYDIPCVGLLRALNMVDPRDYLDKAQALAAVLPSEPSIKLHRRQCLFLKEKLGKTLDLVVERVASYNRVPIVPIPVQYEKVFEEFHHLVQKVKTFVEECCYGNEDDFVLAAVRVIAHRGRFFQYHVELDWCSFLVKCLWDADRARKPVYCQTLQRFDWEHESKSLFHNSRETSNMIATDEGDLKTLLKCWIAKPGEHQAICWALLRRFGSKAESDLSILPGNLGVPPIPTTLGKFIGAGSYGHVHEIKWKEKLFAVKYFLIENVETINNEVKILEHCCHPHIVNLILAYTDDRTQYLMMERLSWDLESYIVNRKKLGTFPFRTSEVVDMISQICEGMLYLNDPGRKVSHRDLKPRNILVKELKPATEWETPAIELQVADFGMAKERKEKGRESQASTSENTPNCGTLLYRAPEMTGKPGGLNIRRSSMKADIYSFAVTCSFILTGTAPFKGYKNTESLKAAVENGARPHLPGNCPQALANLLEWCWNSDPTKRPKSFSEILTELRKLKANLLTSAIEGVEPPDTEAPEEPIVTFNPGYRRLNILVLGDPQSVEAVCSYICGAGRQPTKVTDHVNFRECRNSSPPMCLFGYTKGFNRNDFTDIRTFVEARNGKLSPAKVEALWLKEVGDPGPRNGPALFPDSTLRLHMVWFACRNLSDLPNRVKWPEITKKLCDLPVQILVINQQRTQDLDMNVQEDFKIIFEHGSIFFPNAEKFMEELIVKVDLQDDDQKENLWRKCWAAKTRAEIKNVAKLIREIRKELGSEGIPIPLGYGGARIPKEVSLSRSGEVVFNFLCTYWDIPRGSLRHVLKETTTFKLQASGSKFNIERGKFVEFCLRVAAIILYNSRDHARNPKYVCSWNISSDSSLNQLLQTEARECYSSYFRSSNPLDYDKMVFEDIRLFLERIFEREDPCQAVVVLYRMQGKLFFAVTGQDY